MKNKIKIVFCILLIIAITTLVSVFIYRKEIKSKDYDKITDKIANIDNSNTDNTENQEKSQEQESALENLDDKESKLSSGKEQNIKVSTLAFFKEETLSGFLLENECYIYNILLNKAKGGILEVGKDFTFIGDEYRVQIGNHDLFIDLLFFNRELSCLVAFELKLGEFKAEYLGKMNLYLEALDRDVKKKNENPSVGVILCSSKDKNIVEYSLSKNMSQTLISEYKLKLIDKKLLENKLSEMNRILENEN